MKNSMFQTNFQTIRLLSISALVLAGLSTVTCVAAADSGTLNGFSPARGQSGTVSGQSGATSAPVVQRLLPGTMAGYDPVLAGDGNGNGRRLGSFARKGIKLNDESSVPYLNEHGRQDYRTWLMWVAPKAFAVSESGAWYAAQGDMSTNADIPADAATRALSLCEKRGKTPCKLYAVNNDLVWDQ